MLESRGECVKSCSTSTPATTGPFIYSTLPKASKYPPIPGTILTPAGNSEQLFVVESSPYIFTGSKTSHPIQVSQW
jgi:hypothetical protein